MGIVHAVGQNFMTLVQMDGLGIAICALKSWDLIWPRTWSILSRNIEDFLHCCGETVTVMSYWHLDSMHLRVYQSDRLLFVILPLCWRSHVFTYTNFGFLLTYHIYTYTIRIISHYIMYLYIYYIYIETYMVYHDYIYIHISYCSIYEICTHCNMYPFNLSGLLHKLRPLCFGPCWCLSSPTRLDGSRPGRRYWTMWCLLFAR
jgi:hypothetical protein